PFAIITGILLWLSSLATGWTANYVAVSRMESSISNSLRIRSRLGVERARKLAYWVKHDAPGALGYVVLGFLLGSVPIFFRLFGAPLEVRHVTLNAAGLGFALDGMRMYGELRWTDVALTLSSIGVIGILNIFTSFGLSFLLALRARDIREPQALRFLRDVAH